MEKDIRNGKINLNTKVNGLKIKFQVKEFARGKMGENMTANGWIPQCTEKVPIPGITAGNTKEALSKIKDRVKEFKLNQMELTMMENGNKENNMESENMLERMGQQKWGNGLMVRELNGFEIYLD